MGLSPLADADPSGKSRDPAPQRGGPAPHADGPLSRRPRSARVHGRRERAEGHARSAKRLTRPRSAHPPAPHIGLDSPAILVEYLCRIMNINSISLVRRRRAAILELVREHAVRSQEELQQLLRRRGFTVAQPTLSRDLKDLGLARTPTGYAASAPPSSFVPGARREAALDRALARSSYWAAGIPRELVARALRHSTCFGAFDGNEQVGFVRVISDHATFAYVCDVFVLDSHRGRGVGKQLMAAVKSHPDLQGLRRWVLFTRDAHELYRPFGFSEARHPDRLLELQSGPYPAAAAAREGEPTG